MKIKLLVALFAIVSLIALFNYKPTIIVADEDQAKLEELNKQIEQYQQQVDNLQKQANTLSNQIAQFDTQIALMEFRVQKTEEEIGDLGGRIDELETSLDSLSDAFSNRAVETYKMARAGEPIWVLLSANDLTQAVSRYQYLRKIQEADRDLLIKLQRTQNVYKDQKSRLENLIEQLQQQQKELDSQKSAKANLLTVTKNDEKKYQQLLAAARAELEAIQAIVAGRGVETKAGHVSEGQRIASVIQGPSCNSNGGHLHFIVSESGQTKNPFGYLKSGVDYENCSGSSCGSGDGDSFNPSGSWNWPLSGKITYTQGYGPTWATRNSWVGSIYNFHNGIDINSGSSEIKAVQAGDLYQGSYSGVNGCRLRYVRVDHDGSSLETFYLHVNY